MPHEVVQRALHLALRGHVQRASGLVQQQHQRVLEQRARDGHPLLLPPAQPPALLAHLRVVPEASPPKQLPALVG
eukprot:5586094-Pyramimonas_sp.AAC.1